MRTCAALAQSRAQPLVEEHGQALTHSTDLRLNGVQQPVLRKQLQILSLVLFGDL